MSELQLALTFWRYGLLRARTARAASGEDRDRGATALEWAVISAILLTAAVLVGGTVYRVVQSKSSDLERCANAPIGTAGC